MTLLGACRGKLSGGRGVDVDVKEMDTPKAKENETFLAREIDLSKHPYTALLDHPTKRKASNLDKL